MPQLRLPSHRLRLPRGMRKRRRQPRHSSYSRPIRVAHRLFLYGPYKAIAIAPAARDESLPPPAVANGPARQCNAAFERRITDELAGPHLRTQLVFGNHAVTMFEEILEHVKRLRSQPYGGASPGQGIEPGVEDTIGENIAHETSPPSGAGKLRTC